MRLLQQFEYIDPKDVDWIAPTGWVVDGASIPQFAWSLIGGPFEGKYRDASVLHDVACDQKRRPWEDVHEMFYWGMRASGVERWRAKIMYAAVYNFGPRWPRVVTVHELPIEQTPVAKSKALSNAAPGSTAEIVARHSRSRSFTDILKNLPQKADFDVQVLPPAESMSQDEFEQLKKRIEDTDRGEKEGISIDEIRRYKQ